MELRKKKLFFHPSDLKIFMESRFASYMERWCVEDKSVSELRDDYRAAKQEEGAHEEALLKKMRTKGKKIVSIKRDSYGVMRKHTREAMKSGADVVFRAYLEFDNFSGVVSFLIKKPGKSELGDFHYEILIAKLSKEIKPHFAIYLRYYAEMLEQEQGIPPKSVAVALSDGKPKPIKVQGYAAYYNSLKLAFLDFQKNWSANHQPDPVDSRSFGMWSGYKERILDEQRHLLLVANITRAQVKKLNKAGITTIDDLADTKKNTIPKIDRNTFKRLKEQARIQIASEKQDEPKFKVLPHEEGRAIGLALLPPVTDNDIFFDVKGTSVIDGGLQYLWGAVYFGADGSRNFKDFWAHNHLQENQAFMDFVDWAYSMWEENPSMHIYHYGSSDVAALRRLMGKYGEKEHQIDTLLKNAVFVNLSDVVRNGVLIGERSYSIKNVERLYRDKLDTDVATGRDSVVLYGDWVASPDGKTWKTSKILNTIRNNNIDHCNSIQELANWLQKQQTNSRIIYIDTRYSDDEREVKEEQQNAMCLRDRLLEMSKDEADKNKQLVLRNLAWLLQFHQRENKPVWWLFFERLGKTAEDLYDDKDCLAGLERTKKKPFFPTERSKNQAFEYKFNPDQQFKGIPLGKKRKFHVLEDKTITLTAHDDYDPYAGLISFQSKEEPPKRISLIPVEYVNPHPIPNAIFDVIQSLLKSNFSPSAIVDFLFRNKPRFVNGARDPIVNPELSKEDFTKAIISTVNDMNQSCLCIQGPPGSGKTHTASHVISDLLSRKCRVGISSNSHNAILNLMREIARVLAKQEGDELLIKVGGNAEDPTFNDLNIKYCKNARELGFEIYDSSVCIGATAWVFCDDKFAMEENKKKLDYLFIDEAGQVEVANLVGMSRCARNIVLMGDQMQLAKPIKASHPDESGKSILDYLFPEEGTIKADSGIFLPRTHRMHPNLCKFISKQIYEGRLQSVEETHEHEIDLPSDILPINAGVHFIPVEHEGNSQGSEEEIEVIKNLAEQIIGQNLWDGSTITWKDILFIAPYNYQVNRLVNALDKNARIGTVDIFQGQEAPIVFVSMCASHASNIPRGLDFLFSKNRLNVAISRAQSLAIVVGSPQLATTQANSLEQMELINFYCSIVQYGS